MNSTVTLSRGGYTARIDEVGAALLSLQHSERELLYRVDNPVPTPPFAGLVLAPWPNRIADARYVFDGTTHQLPVTEVELGNALHGLALWEQWTPAEVGPCVAVFTHTVHARPGYPFTVTLSARYVLDDDGLTLTLSATNLGETDAPVGLSTHPYFTAGDGRPLDEWTMSLPCRQVMTVDERLLPTGTVSAAQLGLDYTRSRRIDADVLDHAFTSIDFDGSGRARARLLGASGSGVELSWGRECRWLQVYTLQAPGQPVHRRAVAIEPMTCAPDAFNSGAGLIRLAPGARTTMSCSIAGITG